MSDLHAMREAALGLSEPELREVEAEFNRQFRRVPIAPRGAADDDLPDPADGARRPVSQTTGD